MPYKHISVWLSQIEQKRYFQWKPYFAERVPRHVPRPSLLYKRVRAVFSLFGKQMDVDSGKHLFNANAWKKANLLLKEIAKGYASDIPGKTYFYQRLGIDGMPKVDADGLPLYNSSRCG
jgi:hypothetical protein